MTSHLSLSHVCRHEVDCDAAAAVINEAFGRYPVLTEPRTSPQGILDETSDDAEFLLVHDAGRLVATAMIEPSMSLPDTDGLETVVGADALYLGLAAVATGYNGYGLGSLLVGEVERIAGARGFERVVLGTADILGLPPFYEARGFATANVTPLPAGHWGISADFGFHAMHKRLPRRLRPARLSEVGAATNLINAAYRVEDFFIDGNRTTELEVGELIHNGSMFVLEGDGGRLLGAVAIERPADGSNGNWYFGMLSADPALKGTGLGKWMVQAIEQLAMDAGAPGMDITVVNLRDELHPFYDRLGYVVNGTAPFPDPHKLKRPAHMVMRTKALPARSTARALPTRPTTSASG